MIVGLTVNLEGLESLVGHALCESARGWPGRVTEGDDHPQAAAPSSGRLGYKEVY